MCDAVCFTHIQVLSPSNPAEPHCDMLVQTNTMDLISYALVGPSGPRLELAAFRIRQY